MIDAVGQFLSGGLLDISITVLAFLIVLSIVIFIHELGHFLVARFNGVGVEVFSIGFGREVFGFNDRYGTRWRLSLLPLGGYVKFLGDEDESSGAVDENKLAEMTPEQRAACFHNKSVFQRIAVVAAGPLANFVLAIAIFWGVFMAYGQMRPIPMIAEVRPDTPAMSAGIQPGDLIVSVGGEAVTTRQQVQRRVMLAGDEPLEIGVVRSSDAQNYTFVLQPRTVEVEDSLNNRVRLAQIGVMFRESTDDDLVRLGPVEALGQGFVQTGAMVGDTFRYLGQMISGYRSASELKGPITIARFSGQAVENGMIGFLLFIALLSANLGLINLFPIPMLDGGHLLFYVIEAIAGRPLPERVQEYAMRFGLAVILTLMLFVTFNDVSPLWSSG